MLSLATLHKILYFIILPTGVAAQRFSYGPSWGWRLLNQQNPYIVSAETTLTPNLPPNPAIPRLAIWPGLENQDTLIQPIIVSTPTEYAPYGCKPSKTQWCVFASAYQAGRQQMGKIVPVEGTDHVTMKFTWNETQQGYDQTVSVKGQVISSVTTKSGKVGALYFDTESQDQHKGFVRNYSYSNTKVVFSAAFLSFGSRPNIHFKSCADTATTSDGGKTWIIPSIRMDSSYSPSDYTSDGSGVSPAIWCNQTIAKSRELKFHLKA